MAKALPTGSEVAEKWGRRTKAATADYTAGVQRVSEAPGVSAAKQADLWLTKIQASMEKYKKNVASVSLEDWQRSATQKGAPRISAGVDGAMPFMPGTFDRLMSAQADVLRTLETLPRGTLDENIERMVRQARGMHDKAGTISTKHG